MKKFFATPIGALIALVILAFALILFSCSEEADPQPVARVAQTFTDSNTDARYLIEAREFHLYLLGSADTLTFTSIVPNPGRIGTFDFNAVEGTPGTFKNASFYQGGKQEQGISAGRLEITAFSGDFIEFAYTATFQNGRVMTGLYKGHIKPIK